jgi:hypothetical protein
LSNVVVIRLDIDGTWADPNAAHVDAWARADGAETLARDSLARR